jgi:surfeit locus 1 family protein
MPRVILRLAHGTFTLRLWPTLIAFFMLATLLGLGTWQVERLHWKQNLIATIKTRINTAPVDVASTALNVDDADYHHASAFGLFQHDKEMYLASISLKGEGGYHVLTPLRLENGRFLLVDRGWVPYDKKSPFARREGQVFGPVMVKGILRKPRHHWMQPDNHPAQNEWYAVDLAAMVKAVNVPEFLPLVLEADATPNPGGLPIGGQTRIDLPNNHFVYALTWYGLALVLIVIYGLSGWQSNDVKRRGKT